HVAELAGRLHAALAGQHDGFDLEDVAADFGPRETVDDADRIFRLRFAVAEALDAGVLAEVALIDRDLVRLLRDDVADRLARQVRELALEVTNAGFPRVVADEVADGAVGDLPLLGLQPVSFDLLGDQVALGDLDLLVFRVPRNADDLHAVHQRLRHAQA